MPEPSNCLTTQSSSNRLAIMQIPVIRVAGATCGEAPPVSGSLLDVCTGYRSGSPARTARAPSCTGSLLTRAGRTRTAMRAGRPGGSVCVVEGGGDAVVGLPDLLGQAGELFQVPLAVLHHLLPPRRVDGEERFEVFRGGGEAVEVELVLFRDDADRRVPAADLAVLEPQQPQQRPQVVAVAGPQVVPVPGVALEPVD